MKNIITKTVYVLCVVSLVYCKKENNQTRVTTNDVIIKFEKIPFEIDGQENELHFVNNKQVILFASTDTLKSQIKAIENAPTQRIFLVNETDQFYEVNFFEYGSPPLSFKAFVKKEHFTLNKNYSLSSVNLNEIRYSTINNVYDDKVKLFENLGNVKLINKETYNQNKNKGNSKYIFTTNAVTFNSQANIYSFTTNAGDDVQIPRETIDEDSNEKTITTPIGFSPILQSYVFSSASNSQTLYSFYSKRNTNEAVQQKVELPVYNKENKKFASLINDNDVGVVFTVSELDTYFRFDDYLIVNFTNFKVVPNSLYWLNNKTLIAQAHHTNNVNTTDKIEYILIQFN